MYADFYLTNDGCGRPEKLAHGCFTQATHVHFIITGGEFLRNMRPPSTANTLLETGLEGFVCNLQLPKEHGSFESQ